MQPMQLILLTLSFMVRIPMVLETKNKKIPPAPENKKTSTNRSTIKITFHLFIAL